MNPVSNTHAGLFRLVCDPGPWVGREGRSRRRLLPKDERLPGFKHGRAHVAIVPPPGTPGRFDMPPWSKNLPVAAEYSEIARHFGVSETRAQQLVAVALRKLDRGLRELGLVTEDVLG